MSEPFVHEALFYRGEDEYLAGTVPFIEGGLAAGEPVLVAVPGRNGEVIAAALGAAARGVRFADMAAAGRNPGRIIPTVLLAFVTEHAGARVRIIGEPIWPGRTPVEYPPCVQHEALINIAVAGRPATILCPYDAAGLPPNVIADAENTHPVLVFGQRREPSGRYVDPHVVVAAFNRPLGQPVIAPTSVEFDASGLGAVRALVAERATAEGLSPERALALQIAVNEMAVNTVMHTTAGGTVRVWREAGELVCEITDTGTFSDPLAGRREPPTDLDGVRGLLLVHCLCDLVELYTEQGRTTVRVRMAL